eukprot:TRINITY_DN42213_c0_g1_i2.p1 TRINITY_DN42213_c0_g1~~TRINITY_DN42213_c0_g1_i2.p1  ORF type:complete len:943 (+),score=131.36 TRINITY_DN42213_c0_g1_i2:1-2829(+)
MSFLQVRFEDISEEAEDDAFWARDGDGAESASIDVPGDGDRILDASRHLPPACRHLALRITKPGVRCHEDDEAYAAESVLRLIKALPKHVEVLYLQVVACSGLGGRFLVGVARAKLPSLRHLRLEFVQCHGIDDEAVSRFVDEITLDLECLHVGFCLCRGVGDTSMFCLGISLQTRLQKIALTFRACGLLTDSGVAAVVKASAISDPSDVAGIASVAANLTHANAIIRRGAIEILSKVGVAVAPQAEALVQILDNDEHEMWPPAALALANISVVAKDEHGKRTAKRLPRAFTLQNVCQRQCNDTLNYVRLQSRSQSESGLCFQHQLKRSRLSSLLAHSFALTDDSTQRRHRTSSSDLTGSSSPQRRRRSLRRRFVFSTKHADVDGMSIVDKVLAVSCTLAARLMDVELGPDARVSAAKALRLLSPYTGAQHVLLLSHCLLDEDYDVRMSSATAMADLGPIGQEHMLRVANAQMLKLEAQLEDRTSTVDIELLKVIGPICAKLGGLAKPFVVKLVACLKSAEWEVRTEALNILGQLGLLGVPYAKHILSLLDDDTVVGSAQIDVGVHVRQAAARALVQLPAAALEALPPVKLARFSMDARVDVSLRDKAKVVLASLPETHHAAALVTFLTDPAWTLRVAAAEALQGIVTKSTNVAEVVAPALLGRLSDDVMSVRIAAASALELSLLSDEKPFGPESWVEIAVKQHGSEVLSDRAFQALKRLDAAGRGEEILKACSTFLGNEQARVRLCSIQVVAQLQEATVRSVAGALLSRWADTDEQVRAASVTVLHRVRPSLVESPPEVSGYLSIWTRLGLGLKMYKQRYFVLRSGRFTCWKTAGKEVTSPADIRGCIDFSVILCNVVVNGKFDSSSEGGSSEIMRSISKNVMRFSLETADGAQGLEDYDGVVHLDASNSDLCSAAWIFAIRAHMHYARARPANRIKCRGL